MKNFLIILLLFSVFIFSDEPDMHKDHESMHQNHESMETSYQIVVGFNRSF
tara:strand:+ start:928 stop:1080 length:153 start_codon:yes stop_codon:yes gene_type:complete